MRRKPVNWLIVFLLLLFCVPYIHNLTGWLIHDDEGGYLYQAWRMSEGEIPCRDFYSPKEPLFLFTGYIIFKLFGPNVFWLRMFTVVATILTAYLIFLIGRRVYSKKIAVLAPILYLILPVVYFQARFFRSDAHVVLFSTLGLFLFIKAWQDKNRQFFLYSGFFYAIALGYKFGALLGIIALLTFLIYQAVIERKLVVFLRPFIPFISGLLVTAATIFLITRSVSPSFFDCLISHQLRQPLLSPAHILTTLGDNIRDFLMINPRQYGLRNTHSWIIICSLPVVIWYLFIVKDLKKIFSFYIFSVIFVLFSPYPGEIFRYLLYFLPVAVLVFTSIIFYLVDRKRTTVFRIFGLAVLLFVLVKMFIPGLIKDKAISDAREEGTLALAEYISGHTAKDDYVVADYGGVLFYARRKTTPLMAGMSKSAIENGVITSDKLIKELEGYRVKMILIHKEGGIVEDLGYYLGNQFGPHHFSSLINSSDGIKFSAYLQSHYQFVTNFNRSGQIFTVYVRK